MKNQPKFDYRYFKYASMPILMVILWVAVLPGCGAARTGQPANADPVDRSAMTRIPLRIEFNQMGDPQLTPQQKRLLAVDESADATGRAEVQRIIQRQISFKNPEDVNENNITVKLKDGTLTTPGELKRAAAFSSHYRRIVGLNMEESAVLAYVLPNNTVRVGGVKMPRADARHAIGRLLKLRDQDKARIILVVERSDAMTNAQSFRRELIGYFQKPPVPVVIRGQ